MAEFDDKLNSILSNPAAMAQIAQLAQSLGAQSGPSPGSPPPGQGSVPPPPPPMGGSPGGIGGIAGGMEGAAQVFQALGGQGDSHARALLEALGPYLKPERRAKMERALQLARLFRLGREFFVSREG